MLGKRGRGPMRRTTSITGIDVDMGDVEVLEPSDHSPNQVLGGPSVFDNRPMVTLSPRYHGRSSAGAGDEIFIETAHFLRKCGLCKRSLAPGRDIYMYRGDTAFCSLECREQQMKHDERKEKCSMAASKKDENRQNHQSSAQPTATATVTATSEA